MFATKFRSTRDMGSFWLRLIVGAGLPFVRRSGRRVGAHRKLSRLSDRHQRHGIDGGRAYNQAHKFGATVAIPNEVVSLRVGPTAPMARTALPRGRGSAIARSVVIASGVHYHRLAVENLDAFEGTSVHYWASRLEAELCDAQEVVVVGGGNSAGQAAVFLAEHVAKVWMLVEPMRCDHCRRSFGLILHRYFRMRFCWPIASAHISAASTI